MHTAATARRTAEKSVVQAEVVGGQGGRRGEGGCESAVRHVGPAAAVVAAAGRWCGHCCGVGTSAVPPPWWWQRIGAAGAVVAVARRRCGLCGGGGGSA